MSIQRLPVELIEETVEQISPGSHLSFALTSKRHLKCSQRILSRHRQYWQSHREITDVFDVPSKPEDPVEAWHKPTCVVYRSISILPALQIPGLRSLEVRHFHDPARCPGLDFDPSAVPKDCRSSIQELRFGAVRSVSEDQLKTLLRSIEALKVIRVERCSFDTTDKLVELATFYHADSLEVIHFGENQDSHGGDEPRLYYTPSVHHLQNIRDLVVDVHDIYRHSFELREQQPSTKKPHHLQTALASVLLPSLRRLEVCGMWRNGKPNVFELVEIDDAFVGALEAKDNLNLRILRLSRMQFYSGRSLSQEHDTTPYVRQLSITHFPQYSHRPPYFAPNFSATIEAGHRLGILVETAYHYKTTCSLFGARPWAEHDKRRYLAKGLFRGWVTL